jgi:hypothetical protein
MFLDAGKRFSTVLIRLQSFLGLISTISTDLKIKYCQHNENQSSEDGRTANC